MPAWVKKGTAAMSSLELMVPKAESELFNTAVWRFAEMRLSACGDGLIAIRSEPFGPVDRKQLELWSDAALTEFIAYWQDVRRSSSRDPHPAWRRVPDSAARGENC